MASAGVVPRSIYQNKPQTARMRNIPIIPHPMAKLGDASELMITGTASPDMRRPQTVAGYSMNLASCMSWSESDLVSTKKKRYVKKALVTGTRVDGEVLERVAERLVDGFQGVRQMFRAKDPSGKESVTKASLLRILYTVVGHIDKDAFDRMLLNLGLNKKEKISFDLFVSRFSDIEDIRKQWMTPVKRAAAAHTQENAHPEEDLRDCEVQEWAQLKVAPHAVQILLKALKQRKVDLRSLLPDECFGPNGMVNKLQMRYALLDLGVNLTDTEYRRFWEKFDKNNTGFLHIQDLCSLLNLTPDGEPKKLRPASTRKPNNSNNTNNKKKLHGFKTDRSAKPAAQAAREFALHRRKDGDLKGGLANAFRVEGLRPQSARLPDRKAATEEERCWGGEMPEAVARSKIRAAMRQKQYSKLDSIMDCLHHKFEEHHFSLMTAFKLFDIHDDGHVMHIDFRRVLNEFGFPVTAVQLGLLVQRFGLIMQHGLIGYKQLLAKLFKHTEPLVSRAMDEYLQARLCGGMVDMSEEVEVEGAEEEAIARRLVQYLHQEYLDLALFLLRSDRRNKGVLSALDVRAALERCLGYSMTDKQWAELLLQLPRDGDGTVRYLDFLLTFSNAAAGAWNLQSVGQVTVPRHKVAYPISEEVRRLERAKTEMMPTTLPRKEDHRPLDQLRKELEDFFTEHLHEVEQRFRDLDRKSHKGFSQWQFGALLNLCGFPMTDTELTTFWVSQKLDGDLSSFEDVVRQFLPSYSYATTGWAEKDSKSGQTSMRALYPGSPTRKAPTTTITTIPGTKRAATAHARSSSSPLLTQIMRKVKPAVQNNWEYLRQGFRNSDPNGLGSVSFQQMRRLVERLRAGLTPDELNQLCEEYDFRKNGRCNYLAFMKTFSDLNSPDCQTAYDPRGHVLDQKPKDSAEPITINDALTQIRQKLIRQYKSLRRGFTANDRSRCGSLSLEDFKRVLAECSIPVSNADLYHLLSEFDADMDGRVSYPEFLDALLRMG